MFCFKVLKWVYSLSSVSCSISFSIAGDITKAPSGKGNDSCIRSMTSDIQIICIDHRNNIGQTLKSYALSLNSPHQSNYAPKLRLTHHMHITQPNTCSVIYPDNPVHKSAKTCMVLSCSSDRACAHVLWWRSS